MNVWNILAALFLLGHGLPHIIGFLSAWTNAKNGFNDHPWIFSRGVILRYPIGKVSGLIWLSACAAFIFAAYLLFTNQTSWAGTAVTASVLSLIAILPWWKTVLPGAKYGGTAANIIILLSLLGPWSQHLMSWLSTS